MRNGEEQIKVCVVYLCHDGKGNILLSRRSTNCRDEQGIWDPGGGSIEFGETAEEALQRELAEEYNATIVAHKFLGFRDVLRTSGAKKTHWVALDFKVLIDPTNVRNNEPHKPR